MEVYAIWGETIMVLPDGAQCRISGESPLDMIVCPICNFDDYGMACVPELCDEYEGGESWQAL